jgi:NCK-associated protein 1
MVEKSLDDVSNRIVQLINEVAKAFVTLTHQLTETNSSWRLLQQQVGYKPPKDFVPPQQPGTESDYKRRNEQENLRNIEHQAWCLCSAMNQFDTITVYNTQYSPKEVFYSILFRY